MICIQEKIMQGSAFPDSNFKLQVFLFKGILDLFDNPD